MEIMENMAQCGLGRGCGWWIGKCFNLMIANLSGHGDIRPRLRRPVLPRSIIQQKSYHDMIIKPESNPKKKVPSA